MADTFSGIQPRSFALSLIIILFCICTSCSSPTKSPDVSTDLILDCLLYIPAVPLPPETPENAANPGFIITMACCQQVDSMRSTLEEWFQRLREDSTRATVHRSSSIDYEWLPEHVEAEVKWKWLHSDAVSTVTLYVWLQDLEVSTDDVFPFLMLWDGRAFASAYPDSAYGLSPVHGFAEGIDRGAHTYYTCFGWDTGTETIGFHASANGWITGLVDSTSGGGHLTKKLNLFTYFYAFWDTLGHGRCHWGGEERYDW